MIEIKIQVYEIGTEIRVKMKYDRTGPTSAEGDIASRIRKRCQDAIDVVTSGASPGGSIRVDRAAAALRITHERFLPPSI